MWESIFGAAHDVSALQACARGTLIFFYGLLMLRLSGRRTFARMSALDLIVPIIAGSVMGQALTGSAAFGPAMAGVAVLIFLHWGIAVLVARSEKLARLIEGAPVALAQGGVLDQQALLDSKIARSDLSEALREHGLDGLDALEKTRKVTVEPSGKISVVR